jgi:DNA-binding transcriptional ArsR family regulator
MPPQWLSARTNVSPPAEAIARAGRGAARYIRLMSEVLDIAAIAALVGDPARANMLCALLDGRALTASELAYAAHVTPQTASGHLGKLAKASLIVPAQQGRHRYYRLCRRACRRHDGEHLGGVGDRAAAAQADPHRRQDAGSAHVLRPHRRAARRHAGRTR